MQGWVPIPGTTKGRLVDAALHEFEDKGFDEANVAAIAAKAGVTTGSLYHHFGSKLGLYTLIRGDIEKRLADRMEGAVAMSPEGRPALPGAPYGPRAGIVKFNACRLLGSPPPDGMEDLIEQTLRSLLPQGDRVTATALSAAWRAMLLSVADGEPSPNARQALEYVLHK